MNSTARQNYWVNHNRRARRRYKITRALAGLGFALTAAIVVAVNVALVVVAVHFIAKYW